MKLKLKMTVMVYQVAAAAAAAHVILSTATKWTCSLVAIAATRLSSSAPLRHGRTACLLRPSDAATQQPLHKQQTRLGTQRHPGTADKSVPAL